MTVPSPSLAHRRHVARHMVTWLNQPDPAQIAQTIAGWDAPLWQAARQMVIIQRVAAYFYHQFHATPLFEQFDPVFQQVLQQEQTATAQRTALIRQDWVTLLAAIQQAGLTVMPLKGVILADRHYPQPNLRPMADLDLLIRPAEWPAWRELLQTCGYRLDKSYPLETTYAFYHSAHPQEHHQSDHPANPRPLEVHLGLQKSMWGHNLAEAMWAHSQPGQLYGYPVRWPSPTALLLHVASHASMHFLVNSGCWLHWLDVAYVLRPATANKSSQPNLNDSLWQQENWSTLAYLSLKLAQRALPSYLAGLNLSPLEKKVKPYVIQWANNIPLNEKCGLWLNPTAPEGQSFWARQWRRRWPSRLRLATAYPEASWPLAYLRYGHTQLTDLRRRFLRGKRT